jgi:nitrogen fixation protein NifU and related proteins
VPDYLNLEQRIMSDSYTLYNPTVMDHFLNPRNMGDLKDADGIGEVGAAACGDIMKISLKIKDGKIEDARFKTFGCGSAIASSSMATELIKGRSIEEALNFTNQQVVDALGGLPPVKIHCSVLAEEAIKAALEDYVKRHPEAAKSP